LCISIVFNNAAVKIEVIGRKFREVFNGKQSQFLEEFDFHKLETQKCFYITVDHSIEQDIIMKRYTSNGFSRYMVHIDRGEFKGVAKVALAPPWD
jgi:hypothetical protein